MVPLLVLVCVASASTVAVAAEATTRVEDDNVKLSFTGGWRYLWDTTASGFSQRYTTAAGSAATVKFTGTGVALVSALRVDGGIARVTLDGVNVGTVSFYAPAATPSAPVWSTSGLSAGPHVLKITSTGGRDPGSSGPVVAVDAFDVEGSALAATSATTARIQQDDPRLHRKGDWKRRSEDAAFGDSAMVGTRGRTSVTVRFKGTGITWRGRKSASNGLAEVLLDGKRVAIVGGAPTPARERAVLWAASGLANRTHTVVIRCLGEPSIPSENTGTEVDIDAFEVKGTPLFAPRPTPFKYPWRTYIVIDKSRFKLYWVKDRVLRKVYPIAHGKVGWTTPNRVWRIKAKYHTSPGSVYGPRKMRMFKRVGRSSYAFTNYAIHGTNQEWVIGTRASHGCIRMYNRDVLELFPQVPYGTMVVTRD